ncbi:iron-containing alcohol dehydrogenase [Myxococcota bacterium]|nr:iron-containing alcohol dehydrogenase [Myxococcota bacterium]MBU1379664.1 iron-containing alcohol dehydrogenase [Myxococcota bacterium]MBU1497493.1 iron-containing alcohol dehydrogenase [Myxococcota bacterium]
MDKVYEIRKFVAPEFVFGVGSRKFAGSYLNNLNINKVLLVTDKGLLKTPWVSKLCDNLKEHEINFEIFSDVTPNPRDFEVSEGAEFFSKTHCEGIVAIGGGSPMDCAKGIGIIASNGGTIHDYEGVDEIPKPIPPLVCIPTTSGTSADVSQFAIITNWDKRIKMAIVSRSVIPDVALIDPEITMTMPLDLTVNTGLDALTHAMEALVSNAAGPVTDLYAVKAITLVFEYLHKTVLNPEDLFLRDQMSLASLYAGLAFSNASLGAVHAMAHVLGGQLDLPHGECNAILLPYVIDYNFESAPSQYREAAKAIGIDCKNNEDIKDALLNAVFDLERKCGLDRRLSTLGVNTEMLKEFAHFALLDPCMVTNPVTPELSDIAGIYGKAL